MNEAVSAKGQSGGTPTPQATTCERRRVTLYIADIRPPKQEMVRIC